MSDQKQFRLSVLSLWVGILIPILAAIIPFGAKYAFPEHRLEYSLIGPISVKGTKSVSVKVRNGGEKLEKNVRLLLKGSYLWRADAKKDTENLVFVDTQVPVKVSREGEWIAIVLGDIRASETVDVNVMSEFFDITVFRSIEPSGISIKSDENLAKFNGPSEVTEFLYPFGFWMFVILMVLMFIAAIYQQHFMDPKKREELILKEIDKLPKGPRG